jgi:hypothetical protein
MVTDMWIGDPSDPPLATEADLRRALVLITAAGMVAAIVACAILAVRGLR